MATIKPVVSGRAGNWAISHQRQQDRCGDAPGVRPGALKEEFNGAIEIVSYFDIKGRHNRSGDDHENFCNRIGRRVRALRNGCLCKYRSSQGGGDDRSRCNWHGPAASERRQSERQSGRSDHVERDRRLVVRWLVARHQRLQLTAAAGSRSANGGKRKLLRRDLAAEAMDDMAIAETSDLPRLILRLDLARLCRGQGDKPGRAVQTQLKYPKSPVEQFAVPACQRGR